ncbi:MAG: sulfite oxidase-like oxidoreductase [Fimbriimonadaceae bacterium]|nr:sulfite oxidase-like oxidoreductase [Fimbriimonadaceae bacterium]
MFRRRLVAKKEEIARQRAWDSGTTPTAPERLPPGQHLVRPEQFPILDLGVHPPFDPTTWDLTLDGAVSHPLRIDWEQFRALPTVTQTRDFHCVTTWSKYDVTWRGVPFRHLAELAGVLPAAQHVIAHCGDLGYTTNVPLADMLRDDVLLAYELEGQPLSLEHGGPVRTLVPHLYAWKSAKFVRRLEFSEVDRPGFWEVRGYHNDGDPWAEERFG